MRKSTLFWGSVFLLFGFLWLLQSMNIIKVDVWLVFWPLVMVLLGVWILVAPLIRRGAGDMEQVNIPLEGAGRAKIRINHGAGRFTIQGDAEPGTLVSGSFGGGLHFQTQREDDLLEVKMRTQEMWFPGMWFPGDSLDWTFKLNNTIPIQLILNTGASQGEVDLTSLLVTELRVQTGASATNLILPERAGMTRVSIEAGAASVNIRVPQGVAGRIRARMGIASINVDRGRFPYQDGVYQSPDFDTATNKVEILVQAGIGSCDVK